jgi:hypothetical protein
MRGGVHSHHAEAAVRLLGRRAAGRRLTSQTLYTLPSLDSAPFQNASLVVCRQDTRR